MSNSFIESIKTIINQKIENAGYDKTRSGQIVKVNNDNTYSVRIGSWTYPNVITVNDMTYNLYDVVKVVIPCNQPTQMYITSSILSDNSMGKKVAYATSIAENADEAVKKVNKTYYQDEAPSGTNHQIGDQWYDINDSNTLYVWDGTEWVIGQDSGEAYDIATNTTKYFWASNNPLVGVGILITQKIQQDFIDDPENGGMNILVHNNEILLRDGTTNLVIVNDDGDVQALGNAEFVGDAKFNGNLELEGNAEFNGNAEFAGDGKFGGNLELDGGVVDLYKVTDYPVDSISITANSVTSISNYTVTRENGYRAIGIVGYNTTNGYIRPTANYITDSSIDSNPILTAGFANEATSDLSSQTITFKILWIKATA
jgi:hypothetical protein